MNASSNPKQAAIIVAAGSGTRAGMALPKQFASLGGKPVLRWSVEAFIQAGVSPIIVVIDPARTPEVEAALSGISDVQLVAGGPSRTASVRNGLAALAATEAKLVHIHDAARPGLNVVMIERLKRALIEGADGAAPALLVSDALKTVASGQVQPGPARADLRRVQTPQSFRLPRFAAALDVVDAQAALDDDLDVAIAANLKVTLVDGDPQLMKLTFPEDFSVLERMLTPLRQPRVGSGFDAHRFGPGDHITLCGVRISHNQGMLGHSDADAAWHALTDALLGTIGAGDIGDHFPPTDPQWKGAPSKIFLAHARDVIAARGGEIANVDLTIICERPRIKPHREAMRAATAELLGLSLDQVSVKATTTEEMGFTGRQEGLAAQATATVLVPRSSHV